MRYTMAIFQGNQFYQSLLNLQGFLIKLQESLKSGKIGVTTQQFTFLELLHG